MTLPCWKPRNVLARMNRAMSKGMTDSASRHAANIAEALMTGHRDMLDSEPEHCGVSIGVTVEMLYKERAENAVLRRKLSERRASE